MLGAAAAGALALGGCAWIPRGAASDQASGASGGSAAAPTASDPSRRVDDGLVAIEGGTFSMGSPEDEPWRGSDETLHEVSVSSFFMDPFEVMQGDCARLMGENPSVTQGDALPVENAEHRPRRGRAARRAVDLGLAAAFPLVMATALVEDFAHEWLGVAVLALVAAHQELNRFWWRALARGRWSARRALSTVVDLGLVAGVVAMLASALVISVHAFSWLPVIPGATWARPAHLLGSY